MEGEIILVYLRPHKQNGQFSLYSAAMPKLAETLVRLVYQPPPLKPLPQQYLSKDMKNLNMKSEAYRRLTFEKWPVAFIDKNNLAEAGFYYTDHSDVVCCEFCGTNRPLARRG